MQFLLGQLSFGDVTADADQSHDGAVTIAQRDFGGAVPAAIAQPIHDRFFAIEQRAASLKNGFLVARILPRQFRWEKIIDRLAGNFLR